MTTAAAPPPSPARLLVIMVRYVNHIHALEPEQPEIHDDLEQIGGGEIILPVEPPATELTD